MAATAASWALSRGEEGGGEGRGFNISLGHDLHKEGYKRAEEKSLILEKKKKRLVLSLCPLRLLRTLCPPQFRTL